MSFPPNQRGGLAHHPNSPKQGLGSHPGMAQNGSHTQGGPSHPGRVVELVDAVKHEVEGLFEEASYSKHVRKDLEGRRMDMVLIW